VVLRVNLNRAEPEYDDADPEGYRAAAARLSGQLGSEETSFNLFDVPAGESLCPYHYEYVEEWLLVLDGRPVLRVPEGEAELEPGDLVRFPPGPDGAHKLMNRSQERVRVIMFSSAREPSVAVYPDSDKVGVWTPNEDDKWMLQRGDGNVGYYEGET
jgi:uncharacterized cupin superfamily protein